MRIVIPNSTQMVFYPALAKELGLESSVVLLALEQEIAERGMDKDGHRMIARDNKQMATLFPWLTTAATKKALESLRDRDFVFIMDATLFSKDSTRWYGCNYTKLRTLESIVVLGDGDIEDLREVKQVLTEKAKQNGNLSQLHSRLYPAVVKMSLLTTPLTPRDRGEVGQFLKQIIAKYPHEDFERLQRRILGMRVWHEARFKGAEAPRPMTAFGNWEKYGQFCREQYHGNLPPIPKEWIDETDRRNCKT